MVRRGEMEESDFLKTKPPGLRVGWMWRMKARGCQGGPRGLTQTPEYIFKGLFMAWELGMVWAGRRRSGENIREGVEGPIRTQFGTQVLGASETSKRKSAVLTRAWNSDAPLCWRDPTDVSLRWTQSPSSGWEGPRKTCQMRRRP